MSVDLQPVILCGGGGTRLWPVSNPTKPKQFHNLAGDLSLLQMTVQRAQTVTGRAPIIVTSARHANMVQKQLDGIGVQPVSVIAEPCPRNTAPAIALAAHLMRRDEDDTPMWVLPSDHAIGDLEALEAAAQVASEAARADHLVTFGIEPTAPHTGYGYIRRGAAIGEGRDLFTVAGFTEKPNAETAASYLATGTYLWNSGMFVFTARRFLEELAVHATDVFEVSNRAFCTGREFSGLYRPSGVYSGCPSISVDYAVMEQTHSAAVSPLRAQWSDIGSWAALWEISAHDAAGNVSEGGSIFIRSRNNFVRSSKTVAVVGLDDVIVVETRDGLLVCSRAAAEAVKEVPATLAKLESAPKTMPDPQPVEPTSAKPRIVQHANAGASG